MTHRFTVDTKYHLTGKNQHHKWLFTLYTATCTINTLHFTLHTVYWKLQPLPFTLCTLHSAPAPGAPCTPFRLFTATALVQNRIISNQAGYSPTATLHCTAMHCTTPAWRFFVASWLFCLSDSAQHRADYKTAEKPNKPNLYFFDCKTF